VPGLNAEAQVRDPCRQDLTDLDRHKPELGADRFSILCLEDAGFRRGMTRRIRVNAPPTVEAPSLEFRRARKQ